MDTEGNLEEEEEGLLTVRMSANEQHITFRSKRPQGGERGPWMRPPACNPSCSSCVMCKVPGPLPHALRFIAANGLGWCQGE